jgi:DNA-binding beta-propeller fold protein YncE
VCDRGNDRIQIFKPDGTFVKEVLVAPETRGFGSVDAIAFSPDREQRFVYVADGPNHKVWILRHDDMKVIGSFGESGRGGGQLLVAHALAVDSKGNVYVGETVDNNRVQKFKFVGTRPVSTN